MKTLPSVEKMIENFTSCHADMPSSEFLLYMENMQERIDYLEALLEDDDNPQKDPHKTS